MIGMQFDRIAVVGERELVLGFKLVGVSDVFISSPTFTTSYILGLSSPSAITTGPDMRYIFPAIHFTFTFLMSTPRTLRCMTL